MLHGAAIQFLPVPGLGAGVFREDANLIQHLTRTYLSPLHLDGLLSVVPTAALVLIGSAFGDLLRWEIKPLPKIPFLLLASATLIFLGWAWHFSLPYNKPVWTASYILLTAGLGGVVLTALFALVDVAGPKWPPLRWLVFPLTVYGSNAIAAYVGPILVKVLILREWTWRMPSGVRETLEQTWLHAAVAHYGPYWGGWVYTLTYLGAVWLVLLELYRRKIFLRV